jgi:pantothenate kinase
MHGKFMLTLGNLLEEKWEVRRFHLWYMEAMKVGLENFIINIPAEYFHTATDGQVIIDFHDMYRLLQRKDLDVAQVTLFAL